MKKQQENETKDGKKVNDNQKEEEASGKGAKIGTSREKCKKKKDGIQDEGGGKGEGETKEGSHEEGKEEGDAKIIERTKVGLSFVSTR
jgi:hypothetical protein